MLPSKSSCSFCRIGVWLDGENGGVDRPGTSRDVFFGSAVGADSDGGGEGGRAATGACVGCTTTGGASVALVPEDSMVITGSDDSCLMRKSA